MVSRCPHSDHSECYSPLPISIFNQKSLMVHFKLQTWPTFPAFVRKMSLLSRYSAEYLKSHSCKIFGATIKKMLPVSFDSRYQKYDAWGGIEVETEAPPSSRVRGGAEVSIRFISVASFRSVFIANSTWTVTCLNCSFLSNAWTFSASLAELKHWVAFYRCCVLNGSINRQVSGFFNRLPSNWSSLS